MMDSSLDEYACRGPRICLRKGCEHHCQCSESEWHEGEALNTCLECLLAELASLPVSLGEQPRV